jgi:hypothetical protein
VSRYVVRGYSVAFPHLLNGAKRSPFTWRRDGVAGAAFFLSHREAVVWKRELSEHLRDKPKVVPVEVTMRVMEPRSRKGRKSQ